MTKDEKLGFQEDHFISKISASDFFQFFHISCKVCSGYFLFCSPLQSIMSTFCECGFLFFYFHTLLIDSMDYFVGQFMASVDASMTSSTQK